MSIDLARLLVETATKVITTYNEMGDKQYGPTSSTPCLYRDISVLSEGTNRYEVGIDGILWLGSAEPVVKGDIYYHPSEGYLDIMRITRAKRLVADDSLQFIKCQVKKQRQIS